MHRKKEPSELTDGSFVYLNLGGRESIGNGFILVLPSV